MLLLLVTSALLGPVSLSHCVESHIWSLHIYGLWVWFPCPNCVEFHCPTALNPIYGLWVPYMVFGPHNGLWVQFPCPTVLIPIYGLWIWFPCPNCVEYPMVFGSGFPVPLCSIPYMVFAHIWSLGLVSLS